MLAKVIKYVEKVWVFFKNLKINLSYDAAITLLGNYPKKVKLAYERVNCIPMFIGTQFIIAEILNQPRYSLTDDWIK